MLGVLWWDYVSVSTIYFDVGFFFMFIQCVGVAQVVWGFLSYVAVDLVCLSEELSSRSLYVIFGIVKGGKILFLKLLWFYSTELHPWNSLKKWRQDFPGGPVVKNPPDNARNMGLIPGPGRSHMLQGNKAHVLGRSPRQYVQFETVRAPRTEPCIFQYFEAEKWRFQKILRRGSQWGRRNMRQWYQEPS